MSEDTTGPVEEQGDPLENKAPADPFSPENIGILHFVVLSRIYDVLMLDLESRNGPLAEKILEVHARGDLMGLPPDFSGTFMSGRED